jgi:hypothetical protein
MESYYQLNNDYTDELHFGRESNYEIYIGNYFEQIELSQENIIEKAIIKDIVYEPDIIYIASDGHAGRCWYTEIIDNGIIKYSFRNFSDIVKMYEKKGYKFVKST